MRPSMFDTVTVSDAARAAGALAAELESVSQEQLKLAAQMSVMLGNQLRLAQRSRELNAAMSKLVRNFSNE